MAKVFANNLFPISDNFEFLEENLARVLKNCEKLDISLINFIQNKLDLVGRRKRAFLLFKN